MSDFLEFDSDAETNISHGAFGKQPCVAALVIGAQKNVSRVMWQHERHRDLPGIDEVAVDFSDRHTDAGVRTVGADQYAWLQPGAGGGRHCAVSADRHDGLTVPALGSIPCCFVRQHAVEGAAVDHQSVKMLSHLWLLRSDEGQHTCDLLLGYGAHAGNVVLDQDRHEFRALHRRPGGPASFQRDDAEPRGCCRGSGAASCRAEAHHENVLRFNRHRTPHAAQAGRPARPSRAIEQHA